MTKIVLELTDHMVASNPEDVVEEIDSLGTGAVLSSNEAFQVAYEAITGEGYKYLSEKNNVAQIIVSVLDGASCYGVEFRGKILVEEENSVCSMQLSKLNGTPTLNWFPKS